jgi:hypothetical protein
MYKLIGLFIVFASFAASSAMGVETTETTEATIRIISPVDGVKIRITDRPILNYRIDLSGSKFGNRDRAYAYVDGQKVGRLRQMSGRYTMDRLSLGTHEICIRVFGEVAEQVDQQCVKVVAFGPRGPKDCFEVDCSK